MAIPGLINDKQSDPVQMMVLSTTSQTVDGSLASAQSTVFDASAQTIVRFEALDDVWIKMGTNPTAVANTSIHMTAGQMEYLPVLANHKVAALGGKLNLTACVDLV